MPVGMTEVQNDGVRDAGMHGRRPSRLIACLAVPVLLAAACTAEPSRPAASPSGPAASAGASTEPATPAAPGGTDNSSSEQQGVGTDATLWALFFFTDQAGVRARREVKIVWRMTGSGEASFVASGPAGRTVRPAWGPEAHVDSNWGRPGDEWGTGWTFPVPGDWTVGVTRTGQGTGRLTIHVR